MVVVLTAVVVVVGALGLASITVADGLGLTAIVVVGGAADLTSYSRREQTVFHNDTKC